MARDVSSRLGVVGYRRCAFCIQLVRNPEGVPMRYLKRAFIVCAPILVLLFSTALIAETNCEAGNSQLNTAPPQNISIQELIEKFAGREAIFKDARNHYTYTQEVIVQTLDGDTVDGEF